MNVRLRITSAAWDDIREAYDWYEQETPGAGGHFWTHVKQCLHAIPREPQLGRPQGRRGIRKRLVRVFPYSVYFELVADEARVPAVWHGARNSDSLKPRLS